MRKRIISIHCFFQKILIVGVLFVLMVRLADSAQANYTEQEVDSMRRLLPVVQDTQLVNTYLNLTQSILVSDEEAERYSKDAYRISDSLQYTWGKIKSSFILGHIYFFLKRYDEAIDAYQRGLKVAQRGNIEREVLLAYGYLPNTYLKVNQLDSALHYNELYRQKATQLGDSSLIALSYSKDGNFYLGQALYDLAFTSYLENTRWLERLKDSTGLVFTYGDIAQVLDRKERFEEAIEYYEKSISIGNARGDLLSQIPSLINMSILWRKTDQLDQAYAVLNRVDSILKHVPWEGKIDRSLHRDYGIFLEINLADLLLEEKKYAGVIDKLLDIQKQLDPQSDIYANSNVQLSLSKAYLGLNQYEKAYQMALSAKEGLAEIQSMEDLLESIGQLATIEQKRNHYEAAYQWQEDYIQLKDSLKEEETQKAYKALLLEYETENRDRKIAELTQEKLISDNRRNLLLLGLMGISVIALALILFLRFRAQKNQELLEQERDLDRMKSRFFTQLSHELRTPLTLILGPLNQLLETEQEGSKSQKLQLMQRNAQSLLKLVNQVMDLSKVKAGKLELQARPVQVKPLIRYIFSSFDSKAELKALDYQLFLPEAEVELYLDAEKFQQILSNLLSNGCKFVPPKGKLYVRLTQDAQSVSISVEDNGPGIPPLQQAHIFDPYFQVSGHLQPEEAGTGIGLAISKELTELHGGTIALQSDWEKGTTFTLTFIKGKAHLSEDQINFFKGQVQQVEPEIEPIASSTSDQQAAPEEAPLVLLAEDIPDMQAYIASILQSDFRLMIGSNGKEALALAQKEIPDIVISDIMMPEMDGMAFIQALKADSKTDHIPVIFLTAKSSDVQRMEGLAQEAHAFLSKPFHARELQLILQNTLKNQQRLQVRFQGEVVLSPSEVAVSSQEALFLEKLTDYLEAHIDHTDMSVEEVADHMALSRSQLHRKLKALTGQSPSLFIRNFRLQRAKQLLEADFGNISEIADAIGISSPAYFSRIFTEKFGSSPSKWTSGES
ncbi:MAG: ATP-binding protein [Bacteroidota bacterium]